MSRSLRAASPRMIFRSRLPHPVARRAGRFSRFREAPQAPIRQFDVVAEYARQEALKDGVPPDEAKGYGLWLAKVVAAQRTGGTVSRPSRVAGAPAPGGLAQTPARVTRDLIERMGSRFSRRRFVPAIRRAIAAGQGYLAIRETIRARWNRFETPWSMISPPRPARGLSAHGAATHHQEEGA